MNEVDTMLLVDDDPAIRRLLKRMLSGYAVKWLEAHNIEDGIAAFLAAPLEIRALWVDVQLPDGSGCELAEKIRESAPAMPVVLISGGRLESARMGLSTQDSVHTLQKPFTKPAVLDLAEKLFRSRAEA